MDFNHGPVMAMPMGLMPSVMAIPSLATIPGSAAPTPSPHDSGEVPTLSSLARGMALEPEESTEGTDVVDQSGVTTEEPSIEAQDRSRRVSMASTILPSQPGSYFPSTSTSTSTDTTPRLPDSSTIPSASTERKRPEPIAIPKATPTEPLFSAYPDVSDPNAGTSKSRTSRSKARSLVFPLMQPFNLGTPPRRRPRDPGESSADERAPYSATTSGRASPTTSIEGGHESGRRRANTFTGSPPLTLDIPGPFARHRKLASLSVPSPTRSLRHLRRRRASIPSHPMDTTDDDETVTRRRASDKRKYGDLPQVPTALGQGRNSQSPRPLPEEQMIQTSDPLSPSISPRKSSLIASVEEDGTIVLGLANVGMTSGSGLIEVVVPDDMPHQPPPRRSSLVLDSGVASRVAFEATAVAVPLTSEPEIIPVTSGDVHSLLSSSLTNTDTSASASAEFYSPTSSKEHPLSSATTSLSRSAKSGKEGHEFDEKDANLSAVRLQRSLEWEAKQTRHRRRVERRRMVILELAETELAYTQDLKTLVDVYLPQLASLPSLSDHTHQVIARNAAQLLVFHEAFLQKMLDVLKNEGIRVEYDGETSVSGKLEKVARKLAALFVDEIASFAMYKEFCAGSIAAAARVRHIAVRQDFDLFERRCQLLSATMPSARLEDLLRSPLAKSLSDDVISPPLSPGMVNLTSNRARLHFRDFLITPIQRICRYPLLLNQLLSAATSPSPVIEREDPASGEESEENGDDEEPFDVGVDVERALGAMRGVAEDADEARRVKDAEIKSATIIERLEPHPALTHDFLTSLGKCRLIGSLDVLHHHPTIAPLIPPVKVKYLGAFLYRGYLILAKIKRGKTYEVKHYLPLEVFDLIDITEGFLPHSIRLSLREHNFDLAASCEAEKEVWSAAISEARDESIMPPFELPASVSPFAARKRRMSISAVIPLHDLVPTISPPEPISAESKRNTIAGALTESDLGHEEPDDATKLVTPPSSPGRTSFGFTPDRGGRPSTVVLRRASAPQRTLVDRALADVFSESCATSRSKAQLSHTLFLPDVPPSELRHRMSIKDSTMLRRRRSFLDAGQANFDIAFTGEVRGAVIPQRYHHRHYSSVDTMRSRTHHGHPLGHHHAQSLGHSRKGSKFPTSAATEESSTEMDPRLVESTDEGFTGSELGTLTQGVRTVNPSRADSVASFYNPGPTSPLHSQHKSLSNLRQSAFDFTADTTSGILARKLSMDKRKTASAYDLNRRSTVPNRAKSTPVSPAHTPSKELPPIPWGKDLPPVPSLKQIPGISRPTMPPPPWLKRASKSDPASTATSVLGDDKRETLVASLVERQASYESNVSRQGDRPPSTPTKEDVERTPQKQGTGPWQALRRSMSFIRDRAENPNGSSSASEHSRSDHSRSSQNGQTESPTVIAPITRPLFSRNQSNATNVTHATTTEDGSYADEGGDEMTRDGGDGRSRGTSEGGNVSGEDEQIAAPREGGGGTGRGPKRMRSVRIFQQLSRLTPI